MPLIPTPTNRAEWLALRASRVGASNVAALYGAQPDYAMSHYALWMVKAGRAPEPTVENQRVNWGLRLEEVIALGIAEENNWTVTKGRYAFDDDHGMGASLDFEVDTADGRHGLLETKNVDWLVHKKAWNSEPPLHILLQHQAQFACSEFETGWVGALVGGNSLQLYHFAPRPSLIADMRKRCAAFWQSIADNKPPPVDGSDSAAEVLRAMAPEVVDDALDMRESNEWPDACADFLRASQAKKETEAAYKLARNRVAELLGNHKRGWGNGWSASVVITPEVAERPARVGEIINGRAEARRISVKEMAA